MKKSIISIIVISMTVLGGYYIPNVPWSNKRTYTYESCTKSKATFELCKLKVGAEKRLMETLKFVRADGGNPDNYASYPKWEYDCKIEKGYEVPPLYDNRVETVRLRYPAGTKFFYEILETECEETIEKKMNVIIDVPNQIVWRMESGKGSEKHQCRIIDKSNYKCSFIEVVDGKSDILWKFL